MTPKQLYDQFTKLDIEKVSEDALQETSDARADLNAIQMFSGIRADGSEITPSYTNLTIHLKKMKGQPTDRVTLFDEGDFYRGIYSSVQGVEITTGSNDPKEGKLEKKYSKSKGSIFGLSEKFKAEYTREYLQPIWKKKIEKATGLKMK